MTHSDSIIPASSPLCNTHEGGRAGAHLPSPKLERWKYSNLQAFVAKDYQAKPLAVTHDAAAKFIQSGGQGSTIWAQDAYADMDLWMGLQDVLSLQITENAALNLTIRNAADEKSEGAIHIHVAANVTATLFDHVETEGWINRLTVVTLDDGAVFNHVRTASGNGVQTNLLQVQQAENSVYKGYILHKNGSFTRDQIHVQLQGARAQCYLSGTKMLQGQQHCDSCILIEHQAPHCYSNQNYRNILDGQSRGVFQGKVHVHQIAQQTDGYQLCNSILLSDRAEMDTKPELEIYADDVKCSHGATTAQLEDEPLFYLRARGVPEGEARSLLLQAFVAESLEAFEDDEDIYERLEASLRGALGDDAPSQ